MKITLIQSDIKWQDVEWNRNHLHDLIESTPQDSDIVLLPEMFTTGFTMNSAKFAESMKGPSHEWMIMIADKFNIAVSGSLIIKELREYFNRLLFVEPGGKTFYYDKRHLFRMGEEDKNFSSGNNRVICDFKGTKVFPLICYDLRFPVWSRNNKGYDLLCYHANWPASRNIVWVSLLQARAIENQCFVAGINRVGSDGEGVDYIGNSMLINPRGEIILNLGNQENTGTAIIDIDELAEFRKKFPVWKDADGFRIEI